MHRLAMRFRPSPFSLRHRAARAVWGVVQTVGMRLSPRPFHAWRVALLRLWGARLGHGCRVYPGARVFAPWNLVCGENVCLADGVEVYNPARITLGDRAVISQGAYLCGGTHDHEHPDFTYVSAPITIGSDAWIAARAIVLPGVNIGAGCVVGAGSVVTRDLPPHTLCAGNPCRVIRARRIGHAS